MSAGCSGPREQAGVVVQHRKEKWGDLGEPWELRAGPHALTTSLFSGAGGTCSSALRGLAGARCLGAPCSVGRATPRSASRDERRDGFLLGANCPSDPQRVQPRCLAPTWPTLSGRARYRPRICGLWHPTAILVPIRCRSCLACPPPTQGGTEAEPVPAGAPDGGRG